MTTDNHSDSPIRRFADSPIRRFAVVTESINPFTIVMLPTSHTTKPYRVLFGLLGWLALTFATATVGAIASVNAASFYEQLLRPAWAPPGWLFGPVWSTLYVMMGLAAWLVWKRSGFVGAGFALGLFGVQLAINALWSWLFFAWQLGSMAFVDVILLWGLIVMTVVAFWKVSRTAALLLVPYLLWVTFAMVLTYAVWKLNPDLL